MKSFLKWIKNNWYFGESFFKMSNNHMTYFYKNDSKTYIAVVKIEFATQSELKIKFTELANNWTSIYNYGNWKIALIDNLLEQKTYPTELSNEELLNGKFKLLYKICNHSKINKICYSMGDKKSSYRKYFYGKIMKRYIPMLHINSPCLTCETNNMTKTIGIDYEWIPEK